MTNSKDSDQVMDVKKPGKTTASPTSRPIIVGHGSMMKDPMVREDEKTPPPEDKPDENDQKAARVSHAEVVIAPPADPENNDQPSPEHADEPDTISSASADEDSTDASADTPESADDVDTDGGVIQAVVGKADQKTKERQAAEAEAEKQAAIQQLIKDKKYFVPIHQPHKAKHGMGLFISITVLLTIVVGYALIDIGVLDLGFDVPYHVLNP